MHPLDPPSPSQPQSSMHYSTLPYEVVEEEEVEVEAEEEVEEEAEEEVEEEAEEEVGEHHWLNKLSNP